MMLEMQTALERELKDAKTPEDRALAQSHILRAPRLDAVFPRPAFCVLKKK